MCIFLLLCWAVGVFTLGWAMHRVTWFVLGFVFSSEYRITTKCKRSVRRLGGRRNLPAGKTHECGNAD